MIITLMSKDRICSLTLPGRVRGQYSLCDPESGKKLAEIEAIENNWILKSTKAAWVISPSGETQRTLPLEEMGIHAIGISDGSRGILFTQPDTKDRRTFRKLLAQPGKDITVSIGQNEKNDIVFANRFVSRSHAVLRYEKGEWSITDSSTNGTFVNSLRVTSAKLVPGDIIYIMGLRVVIGGCFLAINNPDGAVTVNTAKLMAFTPQPVEQRDEDDLPEAQETEYFSRSPRFMHEPTPLDVQLDPPPEDQDKDDSSIFMSIGPAMAMGLASMTTAAFSINTAIQNGNIAGAVPSIAMAFSMLLGSILWPILSKTLNKKKSARREKLRQEKYRAYLDDIDAQIRENLQAQETVLRENFPPLSECEKRIASADARLWERGPEQSDFLRLRVGTGSCQAEGVIKAAERHFNLQDDRLKDEMHTLAEGDRSLNDIPVTVSFLKDQVSGFVGSPDAWVEMAKNLIFQLAAYFSYDDVKLCFLFDEEEKEKLDFVRWLPHTWSEGEAGASFRFLASNPGEMKEVSAYLETVLASRENPENRSRSGENGEKALPPLPYFVVFCFSRNLAARADFLKHLYTLKGAAGMSVLHFSTAQSELPRECTTVLRLDGEDSEVFDRSDLTGEGQSFQADQKLAGDAEALAKRLLNLPLRHGSANYVLPKTYTFLEMYGVGKIEHLNILSRWKENNPTKTLEVPVGVDTMGELFQLDLHQKFHGPHGLVAGMTGSGKSEFIITYILSLAVNFHPDEVAFILIDYKGGGMAKSFENLPHVAGIITNLDGGAIQRSLISIQSELKRRQAVFSKASKEVGVSNLDIYKYQRLRREGKVKEALPHLFIISDEFAELKTQQPEFMAQLVSAARIGRSLGVHLILATQKPAGVVDDQIWSNSKFRVCLKVQDRQDSMDMLKRPDAAELVETGRFYLQVGYNEMFELGQSAWAGAGYVPSEKPPVQKDDTVLVVDENGRTVSSAKPAGKAVDSNAPKQLDAITEYISALAKEEHIHAKALWEEPIAPVILLSDIRKKYGAQSQRFVLNPVIGELDDPARQRQDILRLPLSADGNAILFGSAGSGKAMLLDAMIWSLMEEHTPEEVNLYLLDFGAETLVSFRKAPHVGDVLLSYEAEKINNLFRMLTKEIARRKKLFADWGGDYASYVTQSGDTVPNIVVCIQNYAAFAETYPDCEESISFLTREGAKLGILFVLTATTYSGVRFRLQQNFAQHLCLRMNEESEYASVVGKTDGMVPSKFQGRGLVRTDGLYEFQTCTVFPEETYRNIRQACAEMAQNWKGVKARPVPTLPAVVEPDFLATYMESGKTVSVPVGVDAVSLEPVKYPFRASYVTPILSSGEESGVFLRQLAVLLAMRQAGEVICLDADGGLKDLRAEGLTVRSAVQIEAFVDELFATVLQRNNEYKTALKEDRPVPVFPEKYYLISGLGALRAAVQDQLKEKLLLALEKGSANYGMAIVFADPVRSVSGYSYDPWFKAQLAGSDGIFVGTGFADQFQLKPVKVTPDMRAEQPEGFGYVLRKGKATRAKLLSVPRVEEEEA